MDKTAEVLLYLMGCALSQEKPETARIAETDQDALFQLAQAHKVGAMAASALEQAEGIQSAIGQSAYDRWIGVKNVALRRSLLFEAERRTVLAFLEKEGIWYVPLKGILLEKLYPKRGMREMADNDILYDAKYRKQVREWFEARGYTYHRSIIHDEYFKQPVFNFEMHQKLFSDTRFTAWVNYYRDPLSLTERIENTTCGYQFSREQFPIYLVAHAFKHYSGGGIGIRFLSDLLVVTQELHPDYADLKDSLEKLKLIEFYQTASALANHVFSLPKAMPLDQLPDAEKQMLQYMLSSGSYGKRQTFVENSFRRQTALQRSGFKKGAAYLRYRLFPNSAYMRESVPILEQYPFLLPFAYIYRLGRIVVYHKKVKAELDTLKNMHK